MLRTADPCTQRQRSRRFQKQRTHHRHKRQVHNTHHGTRDSWHRSMLAHASRADAEYHSLDNAGRTLQEGAD